MKGGNPMLTYPSRVDGMSFDEYHADPCLYPSLSASIIRQLVESAPARVFWTNTRVNPAAETVNRQIFDLGTAAHAAFVGGNEEIAVIHADDFRTKAAKEAREQAYAAGLTPVLAKDMERVEAMADAATTFCEQDPYLALMTNGAGVMPELSMFWQEPIMQGQDNAPMIYCRARPDLSLVHSTGDVSILHYKTTGTELNISSIERLAANQRWDLTAAHYAAGVDACWAGPKQRHVFLVQETRSPYLCMAVELEDTWREVAEMTRANAMETWEWCVRNGKWPGHRKGVRSLHPPKWHEAAAILMKDEYEALRAPGGDILALAAAWQGPLEGAGK